MDPLPPPLAFFVSLFFGWVNRPEQAVVDYLLEETPVLRCSAGSGRLCLTDDQRRRLASIAGIVTADTILQGGTPATVPR